MQSCVAGPMGGFTGAVTLSPAVDADEIQHGALARLDLTEPSPGLAPK